MSEDLIGYLLNALDADEQQRIENELARDPQLREALAQLRRCLEPLESTWDETDPPAGLADRTCAAIEQHEQVHGPSPASVSRIRAAAGLCLRSYSLADCLVLSLVLLIAFTLLMPAIVNSRYQARKLACQQNLTGLGRNLFTYSDLQSGQFPLVPLSGSRSFAGVFAPILLENELIDADRPQLICPGSDLATDARSWSLPTLAEVDREVGPRLLYLQDRAGGSYAYCVGYMDDEGLHPVENRGRSNFAILSDAPSFFLPNRRSAHHGGRGQNVLFEDGRVAFVSDFSDSAMDNPWLNKDLHAEAGVDNSDSVLLPSFAKPVVEYEPLSTLSQTKSVFE